MISNWRSYPLTLAEQSQHLERAEYLLNTVQPGDPPLLYWSMAEPPGLVLGFSQKETVLNAAALAADPLPIYHRRAGGTAVLVGPHLLDLDVILPAGHPLALTDIVESYRWFGEAWVTTLRQFGVEARIVSVEEAHAQTARRKQGPTSAYETLMNRACYGSLSPYEIVVGQRKIVGLCMMRRRTGTLLQAGLLLHWETDQLARLLGHTPEEQELLQNGLCDRAVGLDTLVERVIEREQIIATFERVIGATPESHEQLDDEPAPNLY